MIIEARKVSRKQSMQAAKDANQRTLDLINKLVPSSVPAPVSQLVGKVLHKRFGNVVAAGMDGAPDHLPSPELFAPCLFNGLSSTAVAILDRMLEPWRRQLASDQFLAALMDADSPALIKPLAGAKAGSATAASIDAAGWFGDLVASPLMSLVSKEHIEAPRGVG